MGAFASMAQNSYGAIILGLVSTSFSLIFFVQLISTFSLKDHVSKFRVIELACLFLIAGILAMRVFYIRFQFIEVIFGVAGLLLAVVYTQSMAKAYASVKFESKRLTFLMLSFYGSIVLYLISMVTVPFISSVSEPVGFIAFVLLISFAVTGFLSKNILSKGVRISGLQLITRLKDNSTVLASLFLLFTLYMGFSKIGFIPPMYADEFPQRYYELVNQAETGKEKPINGKFKHEEFKEKYDRFVERAAVEKK